MSLLAFGINHQTAPVAIRERVAFTPDSLLSALQDLIERTAVNEAAILSTCNRTEVYCGLEADNIEVVLNWLQEFHRLERRELEP